MNTNVSLRLAREREGRKLLQFIIKTAERVPEWAGEAQLPIMSESTPQFTNTSHSEFLHDGMVM